MTEWSMSGTSNSLYPDSIPGPASRRKPYHNRALRQNLPELLGWWEFLRVVVPLGETSPTYGVEVFVAH